ncbi:MAG: hypothetical protein JW900_09790 [Anaerolineae bacterium]|nr:hypothetical protein [Anaerolineae bacterium]
MGVGVAVGDGLGGVVALGDGVAPGKVAGTGMQEAVLIEEASSTAKTARMGGRRFPLSRK